MPFFTSFHSYEMFQELPMSTHKSDEGNEVKGPSRQQLDVGMLSKYAERHADALIKPVYEEELADVDYDTWQAKHNARRVG